MTASLTVSGPRVHLEVFQCRPIKPVHVNTTVYFILGHFAHYAVVIFAKIV